MAIFTKEVKFLSNVLQDDNVTFELQEVTKTATFNEFSRTDKNQHILPFMMASLFNVAGKKANISEDALYDLTVKCVEILLVPTDGFTEQDKTEFLNDSFGLFAFSTWLFANKITPFFQNLTAI